MPEQSENGKRLEGWVRTLLTVSVFGLGLAFSWGQIDARISALEREVSRVGAKVDSVLARELERLRSCPQTR